MALNFRLEPNERHLEWRDFSRSGDIAVAKEEAMIVAVAEIADGLRRIAWELHKFHETIGEHSQKIAGAMKEKSSAPGR